MSDQKIGVYSIVLNEGADAAAFEAAMTSAVLPSVEVGQPTRAGMTIATSLLRDTASGGYRWVIEWEDQGGSRFGMDGHPDDPSPHLEGLATVTGFSSYEVAAQVTS